MNISTYIKFKIKFICKKFTYKSQNNEVHHKYIYLNKIIKSNLLILVSILIKLFFLDA